MAGACSVRFFSFSPPLAVVAAASNPAASSRCSTTFAGVAEAPAISISTEGSLPLAQSNGVSPQSQRRRFLKPTSHISEISSHRAVVAVRLLRIEKGGAYTGMLSGNLMENEIHYVERTLGFRTRGLEDRDFRLVTDIVAGVVRWKRYLDYLIMSLCSDPQMFSDMEPLLVQILRIGVFEIVKLNIPPYAVVDENVKLAKVALRPGAGNLVNAILRKLVLLKEAHAIPVPEVKGDERSQARALSVIYSHPVWMVRRWIKFYGWEDAIELMNWNNSNPIFALRVNAKKGYTIDEFLDHLTSLKVDYAESIVEDFVRVYEGMQSIILGGLLKEGTCSVQDESAGLVVLVVDPKPGEAIIDCCAAPGGKTLFMASRLKGQGSVWALDINKGRLRILEETAKLHDLNDTVNAIHADLRCYANTGNARFDKVLLDAPCSGLGVLSKRADLRWKRHLEDLEQLTKLQDELLDAASKLVKPGAVLVYSTCSIDPQENEERISAFLDRHPDFVIQPVDGFVPPEHVSEEGYYYAMPTKHQMDGAFAARLVRSAHQSSA